MCFHRYHLNFQEKKKSNAGQKAAQTIRVRITYFGSSPKRLFINFFKLSTHESYRMNAIAPTFLLSRKPPGK